MDISKLPAWLRLRYAEDLPAISILRARGQELREKALTEPLREHNALTREMHETEVLAVNFLCPETASTDPQAKLRVWKWVLKQDWGKDFSPIPIHKRVYLGSNNAPGPS